MFSARIRRAHRTVGAVAAGGAIALVSVLGGATTSSAVEASGSGATGNDSIHPMAKSCPEGKLCVWDKAHGQGHRADFYTCKWEDVTRHGLTRVGSFVNNQTDGTVATFYGFDSKWVKQYTSKAFELRGNDQGHKTYGIQVC